MRFLAVVPEPEAGNGWTAFWGDFTGPDWAGVVFTLFTLAVSGYGLWRTRTPKPHWEYLSVSKGVEDVYIDEDSDDWYSEPVEFWYAKIRQNGPGAAEGLESRVQPRGLRWIPLSPIPKVPHVVERGAVLKVRLVPTDGLAKLDVKLDLQYRQLPKTTKVRSWKKRIKSAA